MQIIQSLLKRTPRLRIFTKFEHILFLLIFLSSIFFGFYKLGSTLFNVDAQHWTLRSQNFISAVKHANWKKTYQDPKPGVTLMWISGTSLDIAQTLYQKLHGFRPEIYTYDTFSNLNFAAKAPMVLLNLIFLLFFYITLCKLLDPTKAVVATLFLAFQPYYIGIIQFIHVDGLLTIFMTVSALLLILFLRHFNKKSLLIFSAFFAGLALLTKNQAIFLTLFTGFAFLIDLLFNKRPLKKYLLFFVIWLLTICLTYFAFFPAMWVTPGKVLSSIVSESFHVAQTGNTSIRPFWFYPTLMPQLFTIFVLIMFVIGFAKSVFSKNKELILYSSFVFFYILQMSIVAQKIDRYLLPIFPFTAIIASVGFMFLVKGSWLNKYYLKIIFTVLVLMFIEMLSYTPNLSTKAGGGESNNRYGSLYNKVGEYLNSKPDAKNLNVVAMTKAYGLKPFFKGNVYGHEEQKPNDWTLQYLVTNDYWNSVYEVPTGFENCKLEKSIYFRNEKYWDIYNCTQTSAD